MIVFVLLAFHVLLIRTVVASTVQPIDRWQCAVPRNTTVYEVVRPETKESFDIVGKSAWMIDGLWGIACQQNGLTNVPNGLDKAVQILNLNKNYITRINENDFRNYPLLVALLLAENCGQINIYGTHKPRCIYPHIIIAPKAFLYLANLKLLDLSGNSLPTLPEYLPSSLSVLEIFFTSISPIQTSSLKDLKSLLFALFPSNCVGGDLKHLCKRNFTVDNLVFVTQNVSYIDLSYNNMKRIPNWLFNSSLIGLNLQGNPFHSIVESDFRSCSDIKSLKLSWTSKYDKEPLSILPGALDTLKNLEQLDLSGNMLSVIPNGFLKNSKNLKTLKLQFNCLMNWATDPVNLTTVLSLEHLDLVGNTFCSNETYPIRHRESKLKFKETYSNFKNLTSLLLGAPKKHWGEEEEMYWVSSYGIEYDELDQKSINVLKNLTKLKRLSLAYIGIRTLDLQAFCGLKLTELQLGTNEIGESSNKDNRIKRNSQRISPGCNNLDNCSSDSSNDSDFHSLSLERNAISDLRNYPFDCFCYITHLDLSRNRINYIGNDTFTALTCLRVLNLEYNPLRHIDQQALQLLVNLNEIVINITTYQEEFTLKFLLRQRSANITLHFSDLTSNVYRLLTAYRENSTFFNDVIYVDFSDIAIPPYNILNNLPIFAPFPNLTRLKMVGGDFLYPLEDNFFEGIPLVQKLSVIDCGLKEFPGQALKKLPKLWYLDLSHNELEEINGSLFDDMKNLKILNLSHNFITKVTPGTFRHLSEQGVETLVLNHNRIEDVGPSIIDKDALSRLSYLDLRNNPLDCHCSMVHSFGWLIHSSNTKLYIPGFLPFCSASENNYFGGCLTCEAASLSQPPSLLLYSSSYICQEVFLEILTGSFLAVFISLTALPVLCNTKFITKKIFHLFTKQFGLQVFPNDTARWRSVHKLYAYDAFVCYDTTNPLLGDWVDHVMVPKLETGHPSFRVNVVGKDYWCGTTQVAQLLKMMEASRKTIILLSRQFSKSPQCRYLISVLEERFHMYGVDQSILITFGQLPPQATGLSIRRRRNPLSVLNFPPSYGKESDDIIFWDMLKLSLRNQESRTSLDPSQDLALTNRTEA